MKILLPPNPEQPAEKEFNILVVQVIS